MTRGVAGVPAAVRVAATAALVLLGLVLVPAGARAAAVTKTETADSGPVHAVFTYTDKGDTADFERFGDLHLQVFTNGALTVDDHLAGKIGFAPGGFEDRPSVHAEDLDGDGTVEVFLDLYSGGAHCCESTRFYSGVRPVVEREWGDVFYRLRDLDGDGRRELVSADPAFSGAFTSFAGSVFPLQVLAWRTDRLVDVTRTAPVRLLLRAEARRLRDRYTSLDRRFRRGRHGIGIREHLRATLAAHAADQCSRRSCAHGFALIATARRRHEVPKGFAHDVRKVLRRGGYLG